jgi:hypothetical protein
VATSYLEPDFTENRYRFFFRGYLSSGENLLLVGFAAAWPTPENLANPYGPNAITYYAVAGSPEVGELRRGERAKLDPPPLYSVATLHEEDSLDSFIEGKREAMERLRAYVSSVVGKSPCLDRDMEERG